MKVPIAQIMVGERCRKDLGDLSGLIRSIGEVGLLHPVVVTPDFRLVAGERRLEAVRRLGWTEVPVTVAANLEEAQALLVAERDENTERKDLLPTEAVAVGARLEALERPKADAREKAGPSGKFPEDQKGRVREKVASAVGMSDRTYEKAKAVVEAAKSDPEVQALVEQMDRTGKVDPAYRRLKAKEDEQRVLSVVPPIGRYRTIVVDAPWDHGGLAIAGQPLRYAVMSLEEIAALPIPSLADEECHLYLWTTNNFILRAGEILEAWGFAFKTVLTWTKPRFGLGSYFRSSTEHVLFGVKGKTGTRKPAESIGTHFEAPRGEHSEKPDAFYRIAEAASYPPYLEAFARRQRDGWSTWGT